MLGSISHGSRLCCVSDHFGPVPPGHAVSIRQSTRGSLHPEVFSRHTVAAGHPKDASVAGLALVRRQAKLEPSDRYLVELDAKP